MTYIETATRPPGHEGESVGDPLWTVTVVTRTARGTRGRQYFVVRARDRAQAQCLAVARARGGSALRHRRGASLASGPPVTEIWRSADPLIGAIGQGAAVRA